MLWQGGTGQSLLLLLLLQACLKALQRGLASAADPAALRSAFPFTAPPFAAGGPDSAPEAACAEGSLLSPAYGGECIDCSNAAIEVCCSACCVLHSDLRAPRFAADMLRSLFFFAALQQLVT
jgi:hypothetical protein